MGNTKINQRKFVVKAGMTPDDVVKSANATPLQKKYAVIFDSDGVKGYSQKEADIFNSTTITERGNKGISLWTRYADGSKKETKFKGEISSFKFVPQEAVKPYNMSGTSQKETTQSKAIQQETQSIPTVTALNEIATSFEEMETSVDSKVDPLNTTDRSKLSYTIAYPSGRKSIVRNAHSMSSDYYYENGRIKSHIESEWNGQKYIVRKETEYYQSGKVKTEYKNDKIYGTLTKKDYSENGHVKSYNKKSWNGRKYIDREIVEYYPNGQKKFEYTNDEITHTLTKRDYSENGKVKSYNKKSWNGRKYIDRKIVEYYPNGQKKFEYTNDEITHTLTKRDYFENGKTKNEKISQWDINEYKLIKYTDYDSHGNVKYDYNCR